MVDADDTRRDTAPEDIPENNRPAASSEAEESVTPAAKTAKKAAAKKTAAKKTTAKKTAAKKTTAKKTAARKTTAKKAATAPDTPADGTSTEASTEAAPVVDAPAEEVPAEQAPAEQAPTGRTRKSAAKKTTTRRAAAGQEHAGDEADSGSPAAAPESAAPGEDAESATPAPMVLFKAPEPQTKKASAARRRKAAEPGQPAEQATGSSAEQVTEHAAEPAAEPAAEAADTADKDAGEGTAEESEAGARRRRRRGGRRRRKAGDGDSTDGTDSTADEQGAQQGHEGEDAEDQEAGGSRRRRKRRRSGDDGDSSDDPHKTVTRVRKTRNPEDEITSVSGSTRLEAKKQRRREGREAGRRRAPIVSEAEFLARRESVERVMVIRQREDLTQIAVLEDKVLVEHYVAREAQTSLIGNVYLGRVQNVLPSMEAAFIDIGKGRNAVLYAGEVNWSALGHQDGQPRKIESVLSSGQTVLVQVTKDPIGHKGARLTGQVSLPGRFLVYVPDGTTSGISRKLPDTERTRLKTLLKEIVPDTAGVIVRTAAEGASEDELTRDVERLTARWDDIEKKAKGSAPQLLYGEPDLTLKVVRDLFTEDFAKLVIEGDEAWETVQGYVAHVAPDLEGRLERYERKKDQDAFAAYRIDEQIKKGLERKVWLPSGGSLIIDRTEAMTVVDVNTGKFTGSGGNLEETVTKNNLEAAEEIVRQLRLRDIGGIIVVDFIDMVLESNRDLVLRRLVECLGRDRTRHQVAEVTSLGLVQMTRKRIGTGLLESFSHDCPTCHGRGVVVEDAPVEPRRNDEEPRRARRSRSRGKGQDASPEPPKPPSPKDIAAMARHHEEHEEPEEPEDEAAVLEPEPAGDEALEVVDHEQAEDSSPALDEAEADETEVETGSPAVDEPESSSPAVPPAAPPAEPEKPRVVTRTRRRSASRPAGPPAAAADATGSAVEVAEHPTDESPALHVPVKRKGARKR